jgi:hypothetical protein
VRPLNFIYAGVAVAVVALGLATWVVAKRGFDGARRLVAGEVSASPAFERAAMFVREEARGATGIADTTNPRFRLFAALSAMSYVQANLSSARYSLEQRVDRTNFKVPTSTEVCLVRGIGICGNHIQAFLDIMDRLEVPARPIQIYYVTPTGLRQNHIVAEVEWGGRWHMFDITWGFVALGENGEPLSYAEVRGGAPYRARVNANNPWAVAAGEKLNLFDYLTSPGDVVVDRNGTIHPYVVKQTASRIDYGVLHIPNIVGVYKMGGGREERIAYELDLPDGFDTLTIVPGPVFCEKGGVIAANGVSTAVKTDPIRFSALRGRVRIEADSNSGDATCYVQVKELVAERAQ